MDNSPPTFDGPIKNLTKWLPGPVGLLCKKWEPTFQILDAPGVWMGPATLTSIVPALMFRRRRLRLGGAGMQIDPLPPVPKLQRQFTARYLVRRFGKWLILVLAVATVSFVATSAFLNQTTPRFVQAKN